MIERIFDGSLVGKIGCDVIQQLDIVVDGVDVDVQDYVVIGEFDSSFVMFMLLTFKLLMMMTTIVRLGSLHFIHLCGGRKLTRMVWTNLAVCSGVISNHWKFVLALRHLSVAGASGRRQPLLRLQGSALSLTRGVRSFIVSSGLLQ